MSSIQEEVRIRHEILRSSRPAVRWLIARCAAARPLGKPIGISGQAPSDGADFAKWLVGEQIDSMSLNPDAVITTTLRVAEAEETRRELDFDPPAETSSRQGKCIHGDSKLPDAGGRRRGATMGSYPA